MLNHNPNVRILAEPISSLAGKYNKLDKTRPDLVSMIEEGARAEIDLLTSSLSKLENEKDSFRVIGFNEKMFSPKYFIPAGTSGLKSFRQLLSSKGFRYVWMCI
jgi:hypothetical protein